MEEEGYYLWTQIMLNNVMGNLTYFAALGDQWMQR